MGPDRAFGASGMTTAIFGATIAIPVRDAQPFRLQQLHDPFADGAVPNSGEP
jgi:hypothetical protein